MLPTKVDLEKELEAFFSECENIGLPYVNLTAGQLYKRTIKSNSIPPKHRVPMCCAVMNENVQRQLGDKVVYRPLKGKGTYLEIRYYFPRKQRNQGQNVKTVLPAPPKSFIIVCAYCNGTGKDPHPGNITGENCPKCKGPALRNLPGSQEEYETDQICKGTGRDQYDILDPWKPHDICDGTGLVKVR